MTLNQPVSAYATVYSTEPEEKVEFKYNANGLRTQKKHFAADGSVITTDYTLHGKLITHLTKRVVDMDGVETSEELHFFYDAQSRPAMVEYSGDMYSYLHNLQGDIIGIVDAEGNPVVEYKYDAWGKPIYEAGSLLSTLGNLNPFMYRGYVWDEETCLYYLCSRYYHSEYARFVNSDTDIPTKKRALTQNTYTYCRNSPVKYQDSSGYSEVSFIPDDIEYYEGANEENVNVILFYYVPEQATDIENKIIGHYELAIKYPDDWYVYSFGPTGEATKGNYQGRITIRESADWGSNQKYATVRYAIGFHSDVPLQTAFVYMASQTLYPNAAAPKSGKYNTTKESEFSTYSLSGNACLSFVKAVFNLLNIDIFNQPWATGATTPNTYYPSKFRADWENRYK